jgi:HAE1 family hydrophobic/amphiphilic exporter-1
VSSRFSRRSATVDIGLDPDVATAEFSTYRGRIEEAWPRRPGVKVRLSDSSGGMGGAGADDDAERGFALQLYGRDSRFLRDLAQSVADRLARQPEVARVEIPQIEDTVEVVVELDRDRMQDLAVRPEVLQGTVSSGLQGRLLTEFEERGRETRLVAEFDSEHNPTLLDLKETQVLAGESSFQRLGDLSHIRFRQSLGSIERTDGRTHVSIIGRRAEGVGPLALTSVLEDVMRRYPLPRGYSWSEVSKYRESREQTTELGGALLLGIVLIFVLMGILFESIILPASILFTVPFALLGAYWSLYFFYGSIDVMAFVGMILLSGIIVNNGIVLLDSIARLRREGLDREQAILEGTRRRIRPIVMTAVTTVFGLLPMAVFGESSGMGVSYVTLSITVAGGLTLSTVFTAFVVPLAYTFIDDLRAWGKGVAILGVRSGRNTVARLDDGLSGA